MPYFDQNTYGNGAGFDGVHAYGNGSVYGTGYGNENSYAGGTVNSSENYAQENVNAQTPAAQAPAAQAPAADEGAPMRQPVSQKIDGKPNIVVVGVGGGGCNAVNNMVKEGIKSANFAVMNTDKMALDASTLPDHCRIQLGKKLTRGLGAGSIPEMGKKAAEESREEIKAALQGIDLLFLMVGMGGGTGTGAAPVVASIAKELGALIIAVVTKPFAFEGVPRAVNAKAGIAELGKFADALLVIPNERVENILPGKFTMQLAFKQVDNILMQAVVGVSDLLAEKKSYINVDFADLRRIVEKSGLAHIGVGHGEGDNRAYDAIQAAVNNPLIETNLVGATGLIINFTGGDDMTLGEIKTCSELVRDVIDTKANIIFGTTIKPNMPGVTITIIATGFKSDKNPADEEFAARRRMAVQSQQSQTGGNGNVNSHMPNSAQQPSAQRTDSYRQPNGGHSSQPRQQYLQPEKGTQQSAYHQTGGMDVRQQGGVSSSRIDMPNNDIASFLRRLRENRANKDNNGNK